MTSFVLTLVENCIEEWNYFRNQTINQDGRVTKEGMKETDEGYWQRVGIYWLEGTGRELSGRNTDYPWSAAFISYMMKKSGAKENFRYSELHSTYIKWATKNRAKLNSKDFFLAYDVSEYSPKVGDLVCYSRESGINYQNQPPWYKSHSDIVVEVNKTLREIKVIGGNVGNSVTQKHLKINENGILIDKKYSWFAVIENRL